MAKRRKVRKTTARPVKKGKIGEAKRGKSEELKAKMANRKALWETYKDLQNRADKAWHQFRTDVKNEARQDVLIQDHTHLLLLLGECNYMARECMRFAAKQVRKGRR